MSSAGLRGHEFKLYKPQAHLDIRKIFLPLDLLMSFYWDVRPTSPYPTSDTMYRYLVYRDGNYNDDNSMTVYNPLPNSSTYEITISLTIDLTDTRAALHTTTYDCSIASPQQLQLA